MGKKKPVKLSMKQKSYKVGQTRKIHGEKYVIVGTNTFMQKGKKQKLLILKKPKGKVEYITAVGASGGMFQVKKNTQPRLRHKQLTKKESKKVKRKVKK